MASWSSLASNDVPSYQDLKDAVASGDLACDVGSDCTNLPYSNDRCLNWAELNADFAFDGNNPTGQSVPNKSEIDTYKVLCPDPGTIDPNSVDATACPIEETCSSTVGCCYITVDWTNDANAKDCWDVQVQRDTNSSFTSPTLVATIGVSGAGFGQSVDSGFCSGLSAFTTYYHRARYRNPSSGATGPWVNTGSVTMHDCSGEA